MKPEPRHPRTRRPIGRLVAGGVIAVGLAASGLLLAVLVRVAHLPSLPLVPPGSPSAHHPPPPFSGKARAPTGTLHDPAASPALRPPPTAPSRAPITLSAGERRTLLDGQVELSFRIHGVGSHPVPTLVINGRGRDAGPHALLGAHAPRRFEFEASGERWAVSVLEVDAEQGWARFRIDRLGTAPLR